MRRSVYPVTIFVLLQLLTYISITLWIIWYIVLKNKYENTLELAKKAYSGLEISHSGYAQMISGILILFFILIASTLIFIEWLKARQLYKQGSDHISAFTHELMTPLTCIDMNLEIVLSKEKMSPEHIKRLLVAAFLECKKLQISINQLIELKKIEHKNNILNFQVTNLNKFISDFVSTSKVEHPQIDISYLSWLEGNLFYFIDRQHFRCVLNNLLANAISYCEQPPVIKIVLKKHKRRIWIEFMDNGIGIEKQQLKKIFKIFYRGNERKRGSGLGLYIVSNILKWHKGKIWARSEGPGFGTTFYMDIKLKEFINDQV